MKNFKIPTLIKFVITFTAVLSMTGDIYPFGSRPIVTYESHYVGDVPFEKDRFLYIRNVQNEAARREEAARERRKEEEKIYHGGVDLRKTARFLQQVGSISSAVYDRDSGKLYLVGEENLSYKSFLSEEDIAVIYRSVFDDKYGGVSVTIDPDPENLKKWGVAKYTGGIENTHVGQVLFEADRLLKCLGVGYDNITGKKLNPGIDGYKPEAFIALSLPGDGSEKQAWQRYWFIPDSMEIDIDRESGVLNFTQGDINIRTERMEWQGTGLVTAADQAEESAYSKSANRFVEHIVKNYDRYAEVYPVLYELREIAKLVAIFKWIKEDYAGDVDLSYFGKIKINECATPVRTPVVQAVHSKKEKGVKVMSIHTASGGVTLDRGYKFRYTGSGGSGYGSGGGTPPLFGDIAGFCDDEDDFSAIEYNGKKLIKATVVDPASMSLFEKIISFFNRFFSLISIYYSKLLL